MNKDLIEIKTILEKGNFHSEISEVADIALKESIKIRKKYFKSYTKNTTYVTLDFEEANKIAIAKRGNLKVYHDLPKGIRVVTR